MIEFLIKNNIPHFVAKHYEFSTIYDHRKYNYEVYIFSHQEIKKRWYKEPYYPNLKYRKIKGVDLEYFKLNDNAYKVQLNNKHGKIFLPKNIPFDWSLARKVC
jgi:hypothetical protein